jgi:phosphatidylglycerol:prolipoprotein diacylglycerol transferase
MSSNPLLSQQNSGENSIYESFSLYTLGNPARNLARCANTISTFKVVWSFFRYRRDGKPAKDVDALTYFMILGTVLGARLGHCLFYQPDYYLSNPIEILKIWEGGLASHGATIGIILAMWLYTRNRNDQSWLWILDRIVIVVALGGSLIRLGNLMNSEIIGKPSDLPWSMVFLQPFESALREQGGDFVGHFQIEKQGKSISLDNRSYERLNLKISFLKGGPSISEAESFIQTYIPVLIRSANGDEENLRWMPDSKPELMQDDEGTIVGQIEILGLPRHPAMVYESISTFLIFILLFMLWKKRPDFPEGRIFGLFVVILFTLRFFYEFLKENQVQFEDGLALNMGQFLSIPLVLAGFWILIRSGKENSRHLGVK